MGRLRPIQLLGLILGVLATPAYALDIEHGRVPEPPPGAPVFAGYMEIHNASEQAVTITGARSPEFDTVEIHTTRSEDGTSRMEEIDELPVPPRGAVSLAPRGRHLMIYADGREVAVGEALPIILETSEGEVEVELEVVERRDAELQD